jgi:hypothetical protein
MYSYSHVNFGTGAGAKKIVLPDIEKADREFFAVGPPKIMEQTLGPCTPPGDIIAKFLNDYVRHFVLRKLGNYNYAFIQLVSHTNFTA